MEPPIRSGCFSVRKSLGKVLLNYSMFHRRKSTTHTPPSSCCPSRTCRIFFLFSYVFLKNSRYPTLYIISSIAITKIHSIIYLYLTWIRIKIHWNMNCLKENKLVLVSINFFWTKINENQLLRDEKEKGKKLQVQDWMNQLVWLAGNSESSNPSSTQQLFEWIERQPARSGI